MSVYLVYEHDWSNVEVVGVYATLAAAERAVAQMREGDDERAFPIELSIEEQTVQE